MLTTKHTVNMKAAGSTVPQAQKQIKVTLADKNRFWNKVDLSGGPEACWPWAGNRFDKGYGCFLLNGQKVRAHRVAWVTTNGQIPQDGSYHGLCVCHRCDVPACCNPAHLFLGTNADNVADREKKNRNSPGETNLSAKLTNIKVLEIRSLYATGVPLKRLARRHGVAPKTIRQVIKYETWKHVVDPLTDIW